MAEDLKVVVDAGHAGFNVTAGKRTPDGEYEWNFNNVVIEAMTKELKNYEGIQVKRVDDPTGKRDVPLYERTDIANDWGADIFVSDHHNANTGSWGDWTGTETYIFNGKVSSKTKELANVVHAATVKAYKLKDRGVKKANFAVLREANMPAVLIEGGYMDSKIDIKALRNHQLLVNAGVEIAQGIAKMYGKKRKSGAVTKPSTKPVSKPASSQGTLYRVQVGAFKNIAGVAKFANEVEKKSGIKTYVTEVDDFLKVQLGAFASKENAEKRLTEVKKAGYKDAFITTKGGKAVPELEPQSEPVKPTPKKVVKKAPKKKFDLPNATYYVKSPQFKGDEVEIVQAALASIHFYPEKGAKNNGIDGYWGKKSEDALRRFQSVHMKASEVDGIYGAKTRAALDKVVNK